MTINAAMDSTMLIAAQLAYGVADDGSFDGSILPAGYIVEDSDPLSATAFVQTDRVNATTGLKLIVFKNATTGERIISFRGTDFLTTQDWYSNGQLGWNQWENVRSTVENYIRRVQATDPAATFHFTGHSLGGAIAEYAAYFAKTELELTDSQLTLTTFDGLGGVDSLVAREGTTEAAINTAMGDTYVAHYIANGDLVGLLGGGHVGEVTNGQFNTYLAGSQTQFFLDAHEKDNNPAFTDLSLAQAHDFRPEYLNLQHTQGVLAKIATFGDNDGQVFS